MDIDLEATIVQKLVDKAQQDGNTGDGGFDGFASPTKETDIPEERSSEVEDENQGCLASQDQDSATQVLKEQFKESELRIMVDQVVDRITPIIQACCVTDRVAKAEQNAEEWKSMANLFIKNLAPDIDQKRLFETFRAFGKILSSKVPRSWVVRRSDS